MVAVIAAQAMSAERGGAATRDRRQHFPMLSIQPAAASLDETLSGGANQVGHLHSGTLHEPATIRSSLLADPPYSYPRLAAEGTPRAASAARLRSNGFSLRKQQSEPLEPVSD